MLTGDALLIHGDCVAAMAALDAESIDAVVCDPPYGIEFMGKDWDKFIPHDKVRMHPRWANAKRVDPSESNWGDGDGGIYGKLPSYGGKRTSFQCATCGKRDAFRNPHACGDATDWRSVPAYAGASPDVLAFGEFSRAWAEAAYRVLKPGGHLLAFGGTRMYHRLACGVEDAGFEIRDSFHWIYGSGFPKSLNVALAIDKASNVDRDVVGEAPQKVSTGTGRYNWNTAPEGTGRGEKFAVTVATSVEARRWDGWGTALKPAHEPIVLARKPLAGTVAETVLRHGTGALNVGGCEIGRGGGTAAAPGSRQKNDHGVTDFAGTSEIVQTGGGRWPANVLLAHLPECKGSGPHHTEMLCAPGCPVAELNEASGESSAPSGAITYSQPPAPATPGAANPTSPAKRRLVEAQGYGGAARFFYIAKPRTRERVGGTIRNLHPTVKPIDLMRHLVRLVTPPGGIVLDPFLGSGTTGCAAMVEGFRFVGCELDPESFETSLARISDYAFAHGRQRPETRTLETSPPD